MLVFYHGEWIVTRESSSNSTEAVPSHTGKGVAVELGEHT